MLTDDQRTEIKEGLRHRRYPRLNDVSDELLVALAVHHYILPSSVETAESKLERLREALKATNVGCMCTLRESCYICNHNSLHRKYVKALLEIIDGPTPPMTMADYGRSFTIPMEDLVAGAIGGGKSKMVAALCDELIQTEGKASEPVTLGTLIGAYQNIKVIKGELRDDFGMIFIHGGDYLIMLGPDKCLQVAKVDFDSFINQDLKFTISTDGEK